MTVKRGTRISLHQLSDEAVESLFLLRGAGILGGFAVRGVSTDVCNADGACVLTGSVSADHRFGSAGIDSAIKADEIVITDIGKVAGKVPFAHGVNRDRHPFGSGGAVEDDLFDHTRLRIAPEGLPCFRATDAVRGERVPGLEIFDVVYRIHISEPTRR